MRDTSRWNVESVGHLSARCNVPLYRVLRAMDVLGIGAAMQIDNVDYLRVDDAQRVAEVLAAVGAEEQKIAARARPTIRAKRRG